MDLRLATPKAVSFYLLHNVSTLNQCRKLSCVTVVCKHFTALIWSFCCYLFCTLCSVPVGIFGAHYAKFLSVFVGHTMEDLYRYLVYLLRSVSVGMYILFQ
jgi:hypothetical protein